MSQPQHISEILLKVAADPTDPFAKVLRQCPFIQAELIHRKLMSQKLAQLGREIIEVPSAADDAIPFPDYFAFVPWKHHVEIVTKCKSVEEALFYVMKCINEGWSRHTLENCLHAHYFESCGGAITNFSEKLPSPQSEMAQESYIRYSQTISVSHKFTIFARQKDET